MTIAAWTVTPERAVGATPAYCHPFVNEINKDLNKMGKEIRRVPPHWCHPKDKEGHFKPLNDINYHEAAAKWIKEFTEFERKKSLGDNDIFYDYYWEYDSPPDEEYCVHYTKDEARWYQVYETVSEGTPLTPAFLTQEELIDYLVCHGTFWDKTGYKREVAEIFVLETQYAPSITFSDGQFYNDIDACGEISKG